MNCIDSLHIFRIHVALTRQTDEYHVLSHSTKHLLAERVAVTTEYPWVCGLHD